MFLRVTRARIAPELVDEGIAGYPESIRPLTTLDGYLGCALLIDRSSGEGASVSYWASAEAMQASEEIGASVRAKAGAEVLDIGRFERVIQERTAPTEPLRIGTFIRITEAQASPERIDDLIAFARDQMLPVLRAQRGFLAFTMSVNRETGRIGSSSGWETAADREASESVVRDLRSEAAQRASAENVTVRQYEVAYVSLMVPTPA
jgi:heme-degrading monooxygenase HmoA